MSVAIRRSRMISFRLSSEEYTKFARMCGVRSMSDMARIALRKAVADSHPLSFEVRDLRRQIETTARELERIAELVECRNISKTVGQSQ
jgi:hypothetical protein